MLADELTKIANQAIGERAQKEFDAAWPEVGKMVCDALKREGVKATFHNADNYSDNDPYWDFSWK